MIILAYSINIYSLVCSWQGIFFFLPIQNSTNVSIPTITLYITYCDTGPKNTNIRDKPGYMHIYQSINMFKPYAYIFQIFRM